MQFSFSRAIIVSLLLCAYCRQSNFMVFQGRIMKEESAFDWYFKGNVSKYDIQNGVISGYVESLNGYNVFLYNLSALGFSFSTRRSEIHKESENIWFSWKPKSNHCTPIIEFSGHPFILEKTTYFECSQGPMYYKKREQDTMKTKRRVLGTKKLGCRAWMTVKCVQIFCDFKAATDNWRLKKRVSQELKEALRTKSAIGTLRYYVKASSGLTHNHSTLLTGITTDTIYGHSAELDVKYSDGQVRQNDSRDDIPVSCEGPNVSEIKSVQQSIRDEAKRLIDMSYLCEDIIKLRETLSELEKRRKELEYSLPSHGGLPLQNKNPVQCSALSIKRKYGILQARLKKKIRKQ